VVAGGCWSSATPGLMGLEEIEVVPVENPAGEVPKTAKEMVSTRLCDPDDDYDGLLDDIGDHHCECWYRA